VSEADTHLSIIYRVMESDADKRLLHAAVIRKHYLHRLPPISYGFGAFAEGDARIKGLMTVGKPASITMLRGVAGLEQSGHVYEFNRLWMTDELSSTVIGRDGRVHSTCDESRFVGWMQRWFCRNYPDTILVSYADTRHGHLGRVYQATNWIYTGMTKLFADRVGDGKIIRSIKHRYVWFANRDRLNLLKWDVLAYPKEVEKIAKEVARFAGKVVRWICRKVAGML
jgi:hypothetical protein